MADEEVDFNNIEQRMNDFLSEEAAREQHRKEAVARRAGTDREPTPLGKFIRAQREKQHMSLNELARRSGTDASSILRIERGETRPSVETMRGLAKGLNVPVADVYAKAGVTKPSDLPAIEPYLRTKYGRQLPAEARAEVAASFAAIAKKYGLDTNDSGDTSKHNSS